MNHWERLDAAMAGAEVDHVPISLWRHFPHLDLDPVRLAQTTVAWQRAYDFDLVKFMPTGTYSVEDWGAKSAWLDSPIGSRNVISPGVTSAEQWPHLARLDPRQGRLGQELRALALTAEALNGEVPILETVFSPLTIAVKLAGERAYAHLRRHPDWFEAGLAVIAEAMLAFARASLAAGAHGIFFATQCASDRLLSAAEHRRFGVVYDRRVLDGIAGEARYIMLHMHGDDVMFDQLLEYPVNLLNWHDRRGELSLKSALGRVPGLLVGGLSEDVTLPEGPAEAIKAEVRDAIAQTGGKRLMIGPGCVIPIATPEAHYRAAVEAVRRP